MPDYVEVDHEVIDETSAAWVIMCAPIDDDPLALDRKVYIPMAHSKYDGDTLLVARWLCEKEELEVLE